MNFRYITVGCLAVAALLALCTCAAIVPVTISLLGNSTAMEEPNWTPTDLPTDTPTAAPGQVMRTTPTRSPVRQSTTRATATPTRLAPAASAGVHPTADIVQLANQATMTDCAQTLFYSAHPVVDSDRTLFEQHCNAPSTSGAIELGCYTGDNRIYLLKISDPDLSSEMIVTAAHEMLHVAYAQLTSADQSSVNSKLEAAVRQINNTDLTMTLRVYQRLEPGQRDNELHSILGTEYSPLDPALEQYYRQYFSSRAPIVAAAQHFDQVFAQLDDTLNNLETQIIGTRRQMRVYARERNTAAYNSLVPQLNALVQQYNQTANRYNSLSRELRGPEQSASPQ
jgi:hypothetical protein